MGPLGAARWIAERELTVHRDYSVKKLFQTIAFRSHRTNPLGDKPGAGTGAKIIAFAPNIRTSVQPNQETQ